VGSLSEDSRERPVPAHRAQFLRAGGVQERPQMKSDTALAENLADASGLLDDAGKLWVEANSVIALRAARIGQGDMGAGDEMVRMVAEKVWAGWELGFALASGKLGHDPSTVCSRTLKHYRRAVQANIERLSANER
jgi:hypothetical protein